MIFHAYIGYGLLVALLTYTLANLSVWKLGRTARLDWLFIMVIVALLVQVITGAGAMFGGARPAEWLHFVYAAASILVLGGTRLAAVAFSANRHLVLGVGAAAATLLLARVTATG